MQQQHHTHKQGELPLQHACMRSRRQHLPETITTIKPSEIAATAQSTLYANITPLELSSHLYSALSVQLSLRPLDGEPT